MSSFSSSKSIPARIFAFFASFGLATAVLTGLLLITTLGTLEQVEHGLYESQRKYFESILVYNVDVPGILRALNVNVLGDWKLVVPLPGGLLLLALLFVNLLCGGIIRIRKSKRVMGVIMSHGAIMFLLLAGFVEFLGKNEGNMALLEGQTSNEFQSYHQTVIEIEKLQPTPKEGKREVLVIPGKQYADLEPDAKAGEGKARTFTNEKLPFDLVIYNYQPHAEPKKATETTKQEVIDGYFLQRAPKQKEAETNLDAAYVKVIDKKTKQEQKGILWRAAAAPWSFQIGDEIYAITLGRQTWRVPFAVRLDKFEREVHPGTQMARKFTSYVTKIEGEREEKKIITMNAPLREEGLVLFQASFGQEQRGAGGPTMRSVFAVVENPSDNWPLYALIVVSIGLLLHMVIMLLGFVKKSSLRREREASQPTA